MSVPQSNKTLIGIGELLWDCFGAERRPGGAPANVAFHAHQLGLRARIVSRVGADKLGNELVAHLAAQSLDTTFIQHDKTRPTGTVTVDLSQRDHPQYVIHENVAWDHLECDVPTAELLSDAAVICFGTLAQRSPATRTAIRTAVRAAAGAVRIFDVNIRPPWYSREVLDWSLQAADVVKLNADEVTVLEQSLGLPSNGPAALAAHLHAHCDVRLMCLTCGGDGCALYARDATIRAPGKLRDVVDTVGAGDAFTAGLAYSLCAEWPLEQVAHFANEVGGLVATRRGAMPPLQDELAALIAAYRT